MTSFQSSELTELPVVENSQLFAQRAHSACTAHGTPPNTVQSPISSRASQACSFLCAEGKGQDRVCVQVHDAQNKVHSRRKCEVCVLVCVYLCAGHAHLTNTTSSEKRWGTG